MEDVIEKHYNTVDVPEIRKKIKEFKQEMGQEGVDVRISYLKKRKFDLEWEIWDMYDDYKERKNRQYWERKLALSHLPDRQKKLKRVNMELRILQYNIKPEGNITPEMIAHAREHPITDFIESKNNMALCPFHEDKKPSMYIKNNFYYCFTCQSTGDVIEYIMQIKNLSFKEAVKILL